MKHYRPRVVAKRGWHSRTKGNALSQHFTAPIIPHPHRIARVLKADAYPTIRPPRPVGQKRPPRISCSPLKLYNDRVHPSALGAAHPEFFKSTRERPVPSCPLFVSKVI